MQTRIDSQLLLTAPFQGNVRHRRHSLCHNPADSRDHPRLQWPRSLASADQTDFVVVAVPGSVRSRCALYHHLNN